MFVGNTPKVTIMEKSSIQRIISGIKRYFCLQREFVMLSLTEKLTVILTALIVACILMLLAFVVLIFASLAISSLLAELTGSLALGYGIVAVFYLFVCLLVYANRCRWIADPMANFLATLLLNSEKQDNDGVES